MKKEILFSEKVNYEYEALLLFNNNSFYHNISLLFELALTMKLIDTLFNVKKIFAQPLEKVAKADPIFGADWATAKEWMSMTWKTQDLVFIVLLFTVKIIL